MEWISVEDNVPEDLDCVLTLNKFGGMSVSQYYPNGGWCVADSFGDEYDVTHWQPLPEPPK